jgi:hypothetical protein
VETVTVGRFTRPTGVRCVWIKRGGVTLWLPADEVKLLRELLLRMEFEAPAEEESHAP